MLADSEFRYISLFHVISTNLFTETKRKKENIIPISWMIGESEATGVQIPGTKINQGH